jgi:hypothetical protein
VTERQLIFDIDGEPRTVTIIDGPFADEWPAGDPVPGDKENLGWVIRRD